MVLLRCPNHMDYVIHYSVVFSAHIWHHLWTTKNTILNPRHEKSCQFMPTYTKIWCFYVILIFPKKPQNTAIFQLSRGCLWTRTALPGTHNNFTSFSTKMPYECWFFNILWIDCVYYYTLTTHIFFYILWFCCRC